MFRQTECKKKQFVGSVKQLRRLLRLFSVCIAPIYSNGGGVFGAAVWGSVQGKVTVIDIFMLQVVRQIKCNKKNLCVRSADNMCMYCKWGEGGSF